MGRETVIETYEEKRARIREFNLTSDLFASKVFEDLAACQELYRILMQDAGIRLKAVKTQYVIRNLVGHSVQFDVLAEEITGDMIGIELQMYSEPAPFRRSRYYMSCIDVSILEKGTEYDELPDVTILYITKTDFIGGGRGVYQTCRKVQGNSRTARAGLDNGQHERYFNLKYPTEDKKVNELLNYLEDSDPHYRTESFPRIVERVNFFKEQKEGVDIMCEIVDRIRREGKREGKIEGKIEDVMELLEDLGKVPARIGDRIRQETDLSVLTRWIRCAASASSIAEFEARM